MCSLFIIFCFRNTLRDFREGCASSCIFKEQYTRCDFENSRHFVLLHDVQFKQAELQHFVGTKLCPNNRTFSEKRPCHKRKIFAATCPRTMLPSVCIGHSLSCSRTQLNVLYKLGFESLAPSEVLITITVRTAPGREGVEKESKARSLPPTLLPAASYSFPSRPQFTGVEGYIVIFAGLPDDFVMKR